jgi:signal peptidase II
MIFLRKIALINILVSVLFLADRLTKWLVFKIPEGGVFLWSKNFCGLKFYKNFYLIFNIKIPETLMYGLIAIILVALIFLLVKNYWQEKYFLVFCLSLIIVGAISNLVDRLIFGYVIDFISFFDYSIFNLSDVYIMGGVGLISIFEIFYSRRKDKVV